MAFPGGSAVKNPPTVQELRVQSLSWEDRLEKGMATHSSILSCLENFTDRGAWWATVHGVTKSQTQLRDQQPPTTNYEQ